MPTADWWTTFFHGLAVEMWLRIEDPARTRAEVDFIESTLSLAASSRILDVPCGGGRHSIELARRGHQLTAVDLSSEFIDAARSRIAESKAAVDLHQRDMRDLPWPGRFDAAYCFGNSFAYLDDAGNEAFLRAVQAALKPGGRFLLETGVVLESILPRLERRAWMLIGDIYFLAERNHDARGGRLNVDYTFIRGERVEKSRAIYRTYSFRELAELFARAGLEIAEVFGGLDNAPYETGSPSCMVLARKR